MIPIECRRAWRSADALTLGLKVPGTLSWFQGHFPARPLLPGVAQISWVMYYAAELAPGWHFQAMESVKFQRPVLPDSELELVLGWNEERRQLVFQYLLLTEQGGVPVSSGKIKLCR